MSPRITRRSFLMGTAGVVTGTVVARTMSHVADKVRLGIIGVGGQGEYNWGSLADQEILALCDVDLARVEKAASQFPKAEVVQDFRRVLDRNDIDAVVVSTPDHWHGIISVWAMQTGKHVYCEKPLAHSIYECRVMAETAKRQKRVTQMGTQIHAGSNYRRVVELIQANAIGPVRRVDVWCEKRPAPGKRATQGTPPPTMDYEMWVGPAPMRPYDPAVVPFNWRWWWEFGGGVLADMACHFMDLPHWALNLRHPERVIAAGTEFPDADNKVPVEMQVDYYYPTRDSARGPLPPVHLVWWHGTPGPKDEAGNVQNLGFRNGVLFHGDQGQLIADYGSHKLLPEDRFVDYKRPEPTIPESAGHHREWINAIRDSGTTTCNFDYSGALSETVLLGNMAYRLGKEIRWDPEDLRITNAREREWKPLLRREYRGDWKLKR
jgi:predicted dehydrogenase